MPNSNPHFPVNILIEDSVRIINIISNEYETESCFKKGLDSRISIVQSDSKIDTIAELKQCFDEQNKAYYKIRVWDNYCQFLWVLCYSSIVYIDELIIKPQLSPNDLADTKLLDQTKVMYEAAINLFSESDTIRSNRAVFFDFPNPLTNAESTYIKTTNNLFSISLAFIILHEYSHFYLEHSDKEDCNESRKDEELHADYYALHILCLSQHKIVSEQTAVPVIIAILSTIFVDNSLKGNDIYPDPIPRLNNLLDNLNYLSDKEKDYCYVTAVIIFRMWAIAYGFENIICDTSNGCTWCECLQNIQQKFNDKIVNDKSTLPTHQS